MGTNKTKMRAMQTRKTFVLRSIRDRQYQWISF